MSVLRGAVPRPSTRRTAVANDRSFPRLMGLGTATPTSEWKQEEVCEILAELWRLEGVELERWRRIMAGSGIETRYGVMHAAEVLPLSTAQRMEAYERLAPPLAAEAANAALAHAGVDPSSVTDLIVVSCTGFSAPGLDTAVMKRLEMSATVRRTMVGFMGCFGAINGLRVAMGACALDPRSVALVICTELCSLHLREARDAQNQVASALFADGAAAAVVVGAGADLRASGTGARSSVGALVPARTLLLPQGRDWMTWRITDMGFAMTLTRDVPPALRKAVGEFVADACPARPATYVVHPGGAAILDAVDEALDLRDGAGIVHAREVLRRFGNMSSASVLFVLEEALRNGCPLPALLLAFGPGLTLESLLLRPSGSRADDQ